MIIKEDSRVSNDSLWELERLKRQEEVRKHLGNLTLENSTHFEDLKRILGGNKLVVLKSGDVEIAIIDGSIGDDLKGNDKVSVNIHCSGRLEQYRVFSWGLGEVYAHPHNNLVTGIDGIFSSSSLGNQLAYAYGYPEWFCNKVSDLVSFVNQFMESSQMVSYRDYLRPIQRV